MTSMTQDGTVVVSSFFLLDRRTCREKQVLFIGSYRGQGSSERKYRITGLDLRNECDFPRFTFFKYETLPWQETRVMVESDLSLTSRELLLPDRNLSVDCPRRFNIETREFSVKKIWLNRIMKRQLDLLGLNLYINNFNLLSF